MSSTFRPWSVGRPWSTETALPFNLSSAAPRPFCAGAVPAQAQNNTRPTIAISSRFMIFSFDIDKLLGDAAAGGRVSTLRSDAAQRITYNDRERGSYFALKSAESCVSPQ